MFYGPNLLGIIVLLWDGPHVGMLRNLFFLAPIYLVLLCCYIDELGPHVGMLNNLCFMAPIYLVLLCCYGMALMLVC